MVNPFTRKTNLLHKRENNTYTDTFICGISQDWLKGETDPGASYTETTNTTAAEPTLKYKPVIV